MENITQTPEASIWYGKIQESYGFSFKPIAQGVKIPMTRHAELMEGQSTGFEIVCGTDGFPELRKPVLSLAMAREIRMGELTQHDRSHTINAFTINGADTWFDKATRTSLYYTMQQEQQAGITTTTLWFGDAPQSINLPITQALEMLTAIEMYAKATFSTTQAHRIAIHALDSVDAFMSYDFTQGYPAKLSFEYGAL